LGGAEALALIGRRLTALIVEYFGDLVQLGIDIVGEPFELTPAFAKFCRLVRGPQQVSCFPLNLIHDAAPIETAMQADGNESRLARHEASSLGHDR
jgi:hypothetical protein